MVGRSWSRTGRLGMLLSGVVLVAVAAGALAAPASPSPERVAREVLQLFTGGRWAELRERFAPEVRSMVGLQQLEASGRAIAAQLGRLQEVGEAQVRSAPQGVQVVLPLRYDKGPAWLYVTIDEKGQLLGFLFGPPPQQAGPARPSGYVPAPYADRSRFEERPVVLDTAGVKLPGTFTVPKGTGRYWAVVLVHGSGPQDRDETVAANKPFRDLAEGLATRGVAVLRYDKRTYVIRQDERLRQDPALLEAASTPDGEVLEDALEAVRWASRQEGVRGVVVLGHSLGGMLAPAIAERSHGLVKGLVLMAANARPLEQLVPEQLLYLARLDGQVTPEEQHRIDEAKALAQRLGGHGEPVPLDTNVMGAPARYFYALHDLAPLPVASRLSVPMLLLSGGRDYQVPETDWRMWEEGLAGRPGVSFRRFAALNHLMMPGEGPSSPEEYAVPSHVDPAVIDAIVTWLDRL
ncbi:alpha/beta fold hydrolase [Carboxydochorda subterranea]|uniref:Alpha/beta fold hydrolase n=1 Tax=Carboxydichorda subterranea TaxID=3109565 RepID=A0ABZ1BTL4_9FIRM|nr:alpha/beta fold hydrolase [Limnochorda sp. L945t]WRP16119.1 alpha/beta fold hydrolase [Limnochorda sp. L945t]